MYELLIGIQESGHANGELEPLQTPPARHYWRFRFRYEEFSFLLPPKAKAKRGMQRKRILLEGLEEKHSTLEDDHP